MYAILAKRCVLPSILSIWSYRKTVQCVSRRAISLRSCLCAVDTATIFEISTFKRCSHCARHRTTSDDVVRCRTTSSDVAEIEHIDLTAVFTYRTISHDIVRHRRSASVSYDVVRSVNTALYGVVPTHFLYDQNLYWCKQVFLWDLLVEEFWKSSDNRFFKVI